jgi:hypothetical protein
MPPAAPAASAVRVVSEPVPHATYRQAAPAAHAPPAPQPPARGVGAWIAAWAELVILAFLAIAGAFFASADASPGDYICGMILIFAAIALAFLRLKARFDGTAGDWAGSLLVDDGANLVAVVIVFVIAALGGLFLAAAYEYGGLHNAGIALFVVSGIAVFLNLKRVFDNYDRRPT